jgi:hypothetical protein
MADIYPRDLKKRKFEDEHDKVMTYYLKKFGRRRFYSEATSSEKNAYLDGLENGLVGVERNEPPENEDESNDDPEQMYANGLKDGKNARLNPENIKEKEYLLVIQSDVPTVSQPDVKIPPKPVEAQIRDEFKKLPPSSQEQLGQFGRGSYKRGGMIHFGNMKSLKHSIK